ncbi:MAG: iron-containing alcohol dehydrogenase, partial [Gammaproteobacteria bacterium]|nr:iron-containing alcohol dehydrogenase [Gammaproteobacteria bacterium]
LLQEHPHADQVTADRLAAQTEHCDALIAVGSGTINDLCKYVAARAAKPYAVFATAPSMNGYTSANAAISIDGHKKTLPAVSPTGVFIDLAVLTAAPARLIRAGLGDSSCRSTAQIDWLLSHHLLGTPYRRAPFDLLAGDERGLLAEPNALMRRDLDAMRRLARTLVLSGLGMTLCGGSYPASQGEHLISHYIDMMAARERAPFHHGEQVAVTTLTMARLQQRMLASERPPALGLTPATRADLVAHYGPQVGDACWRELEPKMLSTREAVDRMNERLAKRWGAIVHACESVVIGHHLLEATLAAAQAPIAPESIALDTNFYAGAVRHARELRNRYTFLDLAADAADLPER